MFHTGIPLRPISQPWAHTQFASFVSLHSQVGVYSENSSRWIVADQGVMMVGAVGAVRGSTAPLEELAYIMRHARCCGLVLQDVDALRKMAPELLKVRCWLPFMEVRYKHQVIVCARTMPACGLCTITAPNSNARFAHMHCKLSTGSARTIAAL